MTSWKDCTNQEYGVSDKLKTVLEWYNMEIHQKKAGPDCHRLQIMVKRSIEQDLRNRNFGPETEIMKETPWSRIRRQNSVDKEFLEIVGNGKLTGSVRKETIAVSQPNPSPRSSTPQNEKNASRTRSPRRRSPSGNMARWPCKDYLKGTCNNSFCENWRPPECPRVVADFGKSALMRIARLMNSRLKGPKRMMT